MPEAIRLQRTFPPPLLCEPCVFRRFPWDGLISNSFRTVCLVVPPIAARRPMSLTRAGLIAGCLSVALFGCGVEAGGASVDEAPLEGAPVSKTASQSEALRIEVNQN